jgi:hypothetical protein
VNHPRAVATDRRNGQVLLHLRVIFIPSSAMPIVAAKDPRHSSHSLLSRSVGS